MWQRGLSTGLRPAGGCRCYGLPYWSCVAVVTMATHSSSQGAAALCRVEVCSGNVELLSQLGPRTGILHVTLTPEHAVRQFTLQRKRLLETFTGLDAVCHRFAAINL